MPAPGVQPPPDSDPPPTCVGRTPDGRARTPTGAGRTPAGVRGGQPTFPVPPEPGIVLYVRRFGEQFNDDDQDASVARALGIWQRCGLPAERFHNALKYAAYCTGRALEDGTIERRRDAAPAAMPYFFRVLTTLVLDEADRHRF